MIQRILLLAFFASITVLSGRLAMAQSYIFAGDANGLDIITHPIGYNGTGGTLNVTVGIDPTSANFNAMIIPTQNVVRTWNNLQVTTSNLEFGLPSGTFDFESVLLHEVGHSIGLGHVNIGGGGGIADYTASTPGANGTFTTNAGADNVIGSSDDIRGDDSNLNFFKIADNNPFTLPASGIVDSTTYSRDIADLPAGHLYSANSSRDVAELLGFGANSLEGVMQQGQFSNEAQRTLAASDVAGVLYAQSGLDELQGTADDYDLVLEYVAWDGTAATRPDILIDFDTEPGFAFSRSSGTFLGNGHLAIATNEILVNPNFDWYFNTVSNVPEPNALAFGSLALASICLRRRRSTTK